jgi:hypothetical protein
MAELAPGMKDEKVHHQTAIRIKGQEGTVEKTLTEEAAWAEGDSSIMDPSSAGIYLERKIKKISPVLAMH